MLMSVSTLRFTAHTKKVYDVLNTLQVGDMEKFYFHPKELVHKVASIYVNLGQRSEFCHALPQDGRSFSLSLMEEAAKILR